MATKTGFALGAKRSAAIHADGSYDGHLHAREGQLTGRGGRRSSVICPGRRSV
ncbi:hypothetical protein ACFVZZ_36120 [Streptomyces chartreusis]|uniref:hypothetical protein n=1 Tax=Streptomyces chartreusis TaxID=1969 RepID=UPI0036DA06B5